MTGVVEEVLSWLSCVYVSNRSVHVRLCLSKSSERHRAACRHIRTEATCDDVAARGMQKGPPDDDVATATKTPRTPSAH